MQLHQPFGVVTSTLDGAALSVLALAEQPFTGRRIAQLAGRGTEQGIRNALERLVSQGIVLRSPAGSAYLYELNRQHLAAPYVVGLAGVRDELFARWRQLIEDWPVRPRAVVLFGSAARGDMRPDSDIDLLVIVDNHSEVFVGPLEELQRETSAWTGNDTRILCVATAQVGPEEPVFAAAAEEGVMIVGDRRWLRRAARDRDHDGA